jgi:hypothetical protein
MKTKSFCNECGKQKIGRRAQDPNAFCYACDSAITGYVLHETENIVVIATRHSDNEKTGNMVQVWILYRHCDPVKAITMRLDAAICFDCPNRGNGHKDRVCYVEMKAPLGIYSAYIRGRYRKIEPSDYARVFSGRAVRFGAYGETVLIPIEKMRAIASVAVRWTGYTHQWRKLENSPYRRFVMASCDSPEDYYYARMLGWRAFRVRSESEPLLANEITCPASDEGGKKTQCIKCGLCDGARATEDPADSDKMRPDMRKNIGIIVHGARAKNFVSIASIGGVK